MPFPAKIQMGNHSHHVQLHALPRKGDLLSCSFPASGIPRLFLRVTDVSFHQPHVDFDGNECPEPFAITVMSDGDPAHSEHNDRVFAILLGEGKR